MKPCCTGTAEMPTLISLSLVLLFLSACSVPTRLNTEAFKLVQEGRVPSKSAQVFTDCLMDGFDAAHFTLTNVTIRQQRRSDSYRVEEFMNSGLILSADVFDDGRVQLLESVVADFINTSGERDAFAKCLMQYGIGEW